MGCLRPLGAACHARGAVTFAILLVMLAADGTTTAPPALERGQQALADGRFEEARAAFESALETGASYDALVGAGVALGRLGRLEESAARLGAAIECDPQRSEAWTERGGARFLQKRYEQAIRDLRSALSRRDDAYARELLASALFLVGRTEEALSHWNRIDRPRLRMIDIQGLARTRPALVREAIRLKEGELLDAEGYAETRIRLKELGVFSRTSLRVLPVGEGLADVQVVLSERSGLAESPAELVAETGVGLVSERLQLRYVNLFGRAVTVSGRYRWQPTRPELALFVEWAQPLGLDGKLRLVSRRGRQRYALGEPLDRRIRGVDLAFRRPTRRRWTAEVGLALASRSYSRSHSDNLSGTETLGYIAASGPLLDRHRHRIEGRAKLGRAVASGGGYTSGEVELSYKGQWGSADEPRDGRSVLAVRLQGAGLTRGAPFDAWLAPGGSPDMDWPLRAHRQARDGILGFMPLARSLALSNIEWRQRLLTAKPVEAGVVIFCDAAWLPGSWYVDPSVRGRRSYLDGGIGLRLGVSSSTLVRCDVGFGLVDRAHAIFLGLDQAF